MRLAILVLSFCAAASALPHDARAEEAASATLDRESPTDRGEAGDDERARWDELDDQGWRADDDAVTPREGAGRTWRRLPPRWFWAGLVLTVLSGAATVIAGVTTLEIHDDYLTDRSDAMLRQRGMDLQLATNVLIGATGGFGLATALFALFTDWSSISRQ